MVKKFKNRFIALILLVSVVFTIMSVQLGNLTLGQGAQLSSESESKTLRTLSVDGVRGSILDVNGVPLAYDQSSYDVEFLRDPEKSTYTDRAYYTDIIIKTIDIIEKNGGKLIDTFNIIQNDDGSFSFDFGNISQEAYDKRLANWRKNMYVSETSEADAVYRDLRNRYRIPENMSYEDARKVLSIWQEVQLSSYIAYQAVTIATNVDVNTMAEIEARSDELEGMQITASTTRVYPKNSTAAHVIGYMGKITDEDTLTELQEQGYTQDDLIGITGIEASMESALTGNTTERQGQRVVEVNSAGKVISEVSSTPATQGNDVMLTLDLQMQITLEKALEENINYIHDRQMEEYYAYQADYDEVLAGRELNLARSGAAVVMDVNSGAVLAMASSPSYDLNLFTGGISAEDYKTLREDPASPLFNKAISSKGIPGSIFKLATALAGLSEGEFTLNTTISDGGYFDKYIADPESGEHGPACWVAPYFDEHKNLNLKSALQVSCNYFFFEIADRLGVEKLDEWADALGLTSKTNIELPGEVAGQVGGPKVLYDETLPINEQKTALPVIVYNSVYRYLQKIADDREVEYSDEVLDETAKQLVSLAALQTTQAGSQIRDVLFEYMDVPREISYKMAYDNDINSYISELVWKPTDTAIAGIGAGITALTPIAVARYVSAIANGGTVYDAHIVDRILDADGNVVERREGTVANELNVSEEYLNAIKEGMKSVVSPEDGGSGLDTFQNWKYEGMIAGKTGTGVVSTNMKLEDNAWFVAFAPYDDPEIAVVVYIPNGYKGAYAALTAKTILEYYLDRKYEPEDNTVPESNSLLTNETAEEEAAAAQSEAEGQEE